MADDRSMSLGTVFTAKAGPLIAAIRKVREEMEKLNAVMKGQATAAGGGTRQQAQATRQQSALVRTAKELKREIQDGAKFNTTYAQSLKNMVRENGASTASMKHAIAYHQKLRKTMLNQASAMNAAGQAGTAWMQTVNVNTLRQQALTGAMKQTSQGFVANVQAMAKTTSQAMGLRGVIQGLSNQFQLLGGAMKVSAAYMAAGSVFYQIASGVKAGIKEIIDYDQALKNLSAITGATGKELGAMGDKIKDVASRTKFSTVEVAEGMVLLGQSGFSAEESIQAMDAVANLATGTLTDMKFTTDLLTTTIRAFNLNAFEATKVADVMANAINKSKLTVDKLRIAFNYVGPAAHATGTSLEEVSAAMMVLANSGLRASTIGTGLRQILSRLAAPSDKLRESFQEHGIQMEDLNIRTHGFAGVLKNLHRVFVDSKTGIIDSAKAFELFGLRGANAILALTRSITTGEYKTALDYVYEVGTAAAMADKQIEGLALQFKNLADRAKLLAVELGALGIKDILSWFVQGLRGVVEGIKSFTGTESGSFIARLTIMNAAAFGLAVTLGLLGKALVFVAKTLGGIGLRMLAGPVGVALALATSLLSIMKHFEASSKKGLEAAEQEEMATKTKVQMLIYYKEQLKLTHEEVKKNSEEMVKYNAIIKRLTTDFPDLAEVIKNAGGDIEKLTEILEKHTEEMLKVQAESLFKQYSEIERSLETEKVVEGMKKAQKEGMEQVGKEVESGLKKITKTYEDWRSGGRKQVNEPLFDIRKGWQWLTGATKEAAEATKDYYKEVAAGGETDKKLIENRKNLVQTMTDFYVGMSVAHQWSTDKIIANIEESGKKYGWSGTFIQQVIDGIIEKLDELASKKDPIPFPDMSEYNKITQHFWTQASIDQKQGVQKVMKEMTAQISTFNKWMEDNRASFGIGEEDESKKAIIWERERAKGIADIRSEGFKKILKLMDDEVLYDFASKQKMEKNLLGLTKVVDAEYARRKSLLMDIFESEMSEAEGNAGRQENIMKRHFQQMENLEQEHITLKQVMREKADKLAFESHSDWLEFRAQKEVDQIRDTADKQELALRKSYAQRKINEKEFNESVLILKEKAAHDEYVVLRDNFLEIKSIYNKHSAVYQDAQKAMTDAFLRYLGVRTESSEYEAKENINWAKEQKAEIIALWRSGQMELTKYLELLKLLEDYDAITPKERTDLITESTGSGWDNFKKGLSNARKEMESFGQMWEKIGKEIGDVITDNLVDGWFDFIDGTKTAKEAFIDFAKSTLKWLAQILMKMALMRMFGGLFGGGSTPIPKVPGAHTGWAVGREPPPAVRVVNPEVFENARKYHTGLKQNEVPTIVRKDESILTPGQMSMLKGMGTTTNISVPVQVEGLIGPAIIQRLKRNIEDVVRMTLREEMR